MDDRGTLEWLAVVIRKARRDNTFTLLRARRRARPGDFVVTQRMSAAA
jgi:hypothetical protein